MDVDNVMLYLDFVENRHRAWAARQDGSPPPWSEDPVLRAYKFTNVFRLLDHGSQFLLRELYNPGLSSRDNLLRFFLFRHTGREEMWEFHRKSAGGYPLADSLDNTNRLFHVYRDSGRSAFTNAYLVYPQSSEKGTDKLDSILELAWRLFSPDSPDDVVPLFLAGMTQHERFLALRHNKGVANFMSMQVLTDWGYTTEFRENEFVVPGPGAVRGAKLLDPDTAPQQTLDWAYNAVSVLPDTPKLPDGRRPSLMDVQNTLCEFSKYHRYTFKPLPKYPYEPSHPGQQPEPVIPSSWEE